MEQIANIDELSPGAKCEQALTMLYVQLLLLDDEDKATCCLYMAGSSGGSAGPQLLNPTLTTKCRRKNGRVNSQHRRGDPTMGMTQDRFRFSGPPPDLREVCAEAYHPWPHHGNRRSVYRLPLIHI